MRSLSVPKLAVWATHHIYLTAFSYLKALTHGRTLLHLRVFPEKNSGSIFTSDLFNFRPSGFICFWF